jgi:hypothetical protein
MSRGIEHLGNQEIPPEQRASAVRLTNARRSWQVLADPGDFTAVLSGARTFVGFSILLTI